MCKANAKLGRRVRLPRIPSSFFPLRTDRVIDVAAVPALARHTSATRVGRRRRHLRRRRRRRRRSSSSTRRGSRQGKMMFGEPPSSSSPPAAHSSSRFRPSATTTSEAPGPGAPLNLSSASGKAWNAPLPPPPHPMTSQVPSRPPSASSGGGNHVSSLCAASASATQFEAATNTNAAAQLSAPQLQMSKYSQLLAVLEELGKDVRPSYAGSKSSAERLKRGIAHARMLVREALVEVERASRQ